MENTSVGNSVIDSTSYKGGEAIDTNFLKQFIFGVRPQNNQDFKFPDYTFPCYYWGERYQRDTMLIFTFVFTNEFCCRTIYAITSPSARFEIIDIEEVAVMGGDGGWYEYDYGEWTTDHQMAIVKAEVTENYLEDDEYEEIVDTTWVSISIGPNGFFRKSIDSSTSVKEIKNYGQQWV